VLLSLNHFFETRSGFGHKTRIRIEEVVVNINGALLISTGYREKTRGNAEVRWMHSFNGKSGDLPIHPSGIVHADKPHHRGSAAAFKNSAGREKSNLTDSKFPLIFTFFLVKSAKIGRIHRL
jgi:hypothetical protein